jgi:hypothetical protein
LRDEAVVRRPADVQGRVEVEEAGHGRRGIDVERDAAHTVDAAS